MDIVLGHIGQLVIDHQINPVHINAAGGDISGHQNRRFAGFEGVERPGALVLALVAMNGVGLVAVFHQTFRHPVRAMLGAREDDRALAGFRRHQIDQRFGFIRRFGVEHLLVDPLHRFGGRGHRHGFRIGQEIVSQLADRRHHGGGEHQRLTLFAHQAQQLADRRDKAEIEHLIRFVQHHETGQIQPRLAFAQMVQKTARRRHQDIHAARQSLDLRAGFDATKDYRARQARVSGIGANLLFDLGCQLTRRRQNQGATGAARRLFVLSQQLMDQRQHEGGGLAGAGLRQADQVTAGEHLGDGARLNGGGRFIALFGDRRENGVVQT